MKKCLFNEEKKIYEEIKELPLKNKEPKLNLGEELLANSIIL